MTESRHSLAGTLALVAATLGLLLVAATADREDRPPADEPEARAREIPALDPAELARLGKQLTPEVALRVERLRELEYERIPDARIATTQKLRRLVERGAAKPKARRELRVAEVELRMLGLLEPEASITQIVSDYGAAAAAYYDPRDERLYLLSDAVPAGPELVEFVLAHELTHALEDQVHGLPGSGQESDDSSLAESALIEGTATALMIDYAARHLDPFALIDAATSTEDASADLPRFVRAEIEFTYDEGARFVEGLRDIGDWKLVDFALAHRPPATTEQVLHPEKYVEREVAGAKPPLPTPGEAWKRLDRSEFGEFGTRETLTEGTDPLIARQAAAGWDADAYSLWRRPGATGSCVAECAGDHALAVAWRWDTRRDAREFAEALTDYSAAVVDGATEVQTRGTVVRYAIAPTAPVAARLAKAP